MPLRLPARPDPLPTAAAAIAIATVTVGVALHEAHGSLGTATPPFVMAFGLAAEALWALLAAAALALVVTVAPALLRAPRRPVAFAAALTALALGCALTLNAVRHGTGGWSTIFDVGPGGSFEAQNEYLPGLPALSYGPRFFLDRFAELVSSLPVNVAGHPPGLLLVLHATGIDTAGALAALCIGAAALVPALAYALARVLGQGEATARTAGLLAAACPVLLLFGTTSADAVFAAAGTVAACGLAARAPAARAAGAVALAGASLLSWALLAIGAWAVVLAWRRDGRHAALTLAGGCALAVVALNAALAGWTGYDPIGTLRATEAYYRHSVASMRPYAFWVFGAPVAFGVLLGPALAGAALRAARRGAPEAVALAAVIAIAALGGFTKAETERIWLPFVALACVAAAPLVSTARLRLVIAGLAAQALVIAIAFDTVW